MTADSGGGMEPGRGTAAAQAGVAGGASWREIVAPSMRDPRGTLAVLEGAALPFRVERIFYVYDVEPGGSRGAHAHRELHQCLVCLTGGMVVRLDDGVTQQAVAVNDPARALYIPPMTWATETDFAPGTTYFVLTSAPYDESDYFRRYEDFLAAATRGRT